MTSLGEVDRICAVCGTTSRHITYYSYSEHGPVDLDTRPPETYRSTLPMWVQTCPHCGFTSHDISQLVLRAEETVSSESYKIQLNEESLPEKVRSFLCHSLIQENAGDFMRSAKYRMFAAWYCDDGNQDAMAQRCRSLAVDHFREALARKQQFAEIMGGQQCLIVDLLRRSRNFGAASEMINATLKTPLEPLFLKIIEFESGLISDSDVGCYNLNDLEKQSAP